MPIDYVELLEKTGQTDNERVREMAGRALVHRAVREQLIAFPPSSRYQVIVRVGSDALPWDSQSRKPTAINLWVHGRGTRWHIVNVVHVSLGHPVEQRKY